MPTYPLPTLATTISPTGATAPDFQNILASLLTSEQIIFGEDNYLPPDSQDGQIVAVFSAAINDSNNATIAAYLGYSPAFAVGAQLSGNVKNVGIVRNTGSNSTVELVLVGVAGTPLDGAVARDVNGNLWDIPDGTTIPSSGTITVTAVAETEGNIAVEPGDVNERYTQILGWQTVTNPAAAAPGIDVETDAALRRRQAISAALPGLTPLQTISAGVAAVLNVQRSKVYENDTNETDSNGLPPHSVSAVVLGGDATAVAQIIEAKKSPGTGTYGTTHIVVTDPAGVPIRINFYELTQVNIYINITIQALNGYVASTGQAIINALIAFITSLAIGQELYYDWLFGPAALYGSGLEFTFRIVSITAGFDMDPTGTDDMPIAFNEAANCAITNVVLTVNPS